MVMHSTKDLTHPEMIKLKTKDRSDSRQRNKSIHMFHDENDHKDSVRFKVNLSKDRKIKIFEAKDSNYRRRLKKQNTEVQNTIETDRENMLDFDIDEMIKQQESKIL